MGNSYKLNKDDVTVIKDGKSRRYKFNSVKGACLKVLIDSINKEMSVIDICKDADKILKTYGRDPFADRGRDIRSLHGQLGLIEKTSKGNYIFTGKFKGSNLNPFPPELKEKILKRDNYQCVRCGGSRQQGFELMIDHMLPESKGGQATFDNGMTLCTQCNNIKSNYSVFTFGRKLFEQYLNTSRALGNKKDELFFEEVVRVFDKHNRS